MRIWMSRLILAALTLVIASLPLFAHPMGNFSINHYSRLHASQNHISVHTVLDYAEIPTFQLFGEWGVPADRTVAPVQIEAKVANHVKSLGRQLRILINGIPASFTLSNVQSEVAPGAGDLPILRISFDLSAPWKADFARIEFFDETYSERIGWKEIVVTADSALGFPEGNGFQVDRSGELRHYPNDPLSSAPNVTAVSLPIAPAPTGVFTEHVANPVVGTAAAGQTGFFSGSIVKGDRLSEILGQRDLPLRMVLIGLAIAFVLGALHAMSPGHGKTLVAAYLVGNRGTARHAVFLGAIVTFAHTVGVFALGIVTLFASSYIVPEKLYPWMGLLSGIMIVVIGLNVFRGRLSRFQHEEHDHQHGPGGHTHDMPETITLRSLLALGVSGGIVPCPSALV